MKKILSSKKIKLGQTQTLWQFNIILNEMDRRQTMKTIKLLFVLLVLLFLNTSCLIIDGIEDSDDQVRGSGYLVTEQRTLPDFNSVEMNTAGKVYISSGAEQEVTVAVDQNIAEYITTSVNDGKLYIGTQRGVSLSNYKLIINLTMTDLEELVTNSSGDIIGQNKFEADVVSLVTNSSGDISLELEANQLYSRISSAGDIYLNGIINRHDATISSSGDLIAFNLATDTTKIILSSSGDAEVFATHLLYATISSSGSLYYKGHPTIYPTVSSSGRLINAN